MATAMENIAKDVRSNTDSSAGLGGRAQQEWAELHNSAHSVFVVHKLQAGEEIAYP